MESLSVTTLMPELDQALVFRIIETELCMHPQAEPIDFYKLIYQAAYGPSHMRADNSLIQSYIASELGSMEGSYEPYCQDIGQAFLRISLSTLIHDLSTVDIQILDSRIAFLADLILKSMLPDGINQKNWIVLWNSTLPIIEQVIRIGAADRQLIDQALNNDQIPHHSEAYRALYHPHYRIIDRNYLQELQEFLGIQDILEIK